MAASGSAQPVTPPKAAAPAPVAPAYPKWFSRPPALRPAGEHAPSAPTAPKAKAKKRGNRGPSQEWREGNRFRAMSELKDQEAAAAQQHVVQTQRDAFSETLQRQKAYYENKIQQYSLSLAANQQLQEDHSKMKQELTEAKVTYQENLQKQRAYYDNQIEGNKAAYQWLLEQHEKTKQDLQELKEAKTSYQEKLQRARAYYEKKIEDLNFMLSEKQKKKTQKDMECQKLQEKLSNTERTYLKQFGEKNLECQKLQEKLTKRERCYFKQLEEAKRVKEEDSTSSPTSPSNKKIKAAQAARPKKAGLAGDQLALR